MRKLSRARRNTSLPPLCNPVEKMHTTTWIMWQSSRLFFRKHDFRSHVGRRALQHAYCSKHLDFVSSAQRATRSDRLANDLTTEQKHGWIRLNHSLRKLKPCSHWWILCARRARYWSSRQMERDSVRSRCKAALGKNSVHLLYSRSLAQENSASTKTGLDKQQLGCRPHRTQNGKLRELHTTNSS